MNCFLFFKHGSRRGVEIARTECSSGFLRVKVSFFRTPLDQSSSCPPAGNPKHEYIRKQFGIAGLVRGDVDKGDALPQRAVLDTTFMGPRGLS
jgi:hypothetical protein